MSDDDDYSRDFGRPAEPTVDVIIAAAKAANAISALKQGRVVQDDPPVDILNLLGGGRVFMPSSPAPPINIIGDNVAQVIEIIVPPCSVNKEHCEWCDRTP